MRIADMHCDTVSRVYYALKSGKQTGMWDNDFSVDFKRMKEAGYLMQFFACFVNKMKAKDITADALGMVKLLKSEIDKHSDIIGLVRSSDDIRRNIADNRMSALLTLEEGGVLGGSIDRLHEFHEEGVRLITLTWNYENEIGYPNIIDTVTGRCEPETERGLKPCGIEIVKEMERLGMIIDVSHLGDAGFYDVACNTTKPFIASHSNARALAGHVRNLKDDMIRIIGERGGIIGINFCPAFLDYYSGKEDSRVEDMVRHILYIRNLGGSDVCALGSDLDGISGRLEIDSCDKIHRLADALASGGLSYDEIDKIMSKNLIDFLINRNKL